MFISRRTWTVIVVLVGLAFVSLPWWVEGYWIRVTTSIFMYGVITAALNIIAGYAGYAAFGNIVFFGVGAYTTAILMLRLGFYWWAGILMGGIVAAIYAALLGSAILRLKGP